MKSNIFMTKVYYLFFSSSSALIFRLNLGSNCCRSSLIDSLSWIWACLPFAFVKRKVFALPSLSMTWSWTFSFESGDIFWAVEKSTPTISYDMIAQCLKIRVKAAYFRSFWIHTIGFLIIEHARLISAVPPNVWSY